MVLPLQFKVFVTLYKNMRYEHHSYFLQQIYISEPRLCPEAIGSIEYVLSCPTSKQEWDTAASKKNCSRLASLQNCSSAEQLKYHCVINGFRNETLEVCAPSRIIFGISFMHNFYSISLCLLYCLKQIYQFVKVIQNMYKFFRTLCRIQSSRRSNSGSNVISMQQHFSQM